MSPRSCLLDLDHDAYWSEQRVLQVVSRTFEVERQASASSNPSSRQSL